MRKIQRGMRIGVSGPRRVKRLAARLYNCSLFDVSNAQDNLGAYTIDHHVKLAQFFWPVFQVCQQTSDKKLLVLK